MSFQTFGNYEYSAHRLFELLKYMTINDRFVYLNQLREFYRPWGWNYGQNYHQAGTTIKRTKNKFQIDVDVQHFTPDEITVKMVDGYVVIEGEHEERQDEHGFITRQFTRKYCVPDGYNPDLAESKLSSDGVLSVIVQKFSGEAKNVRAIPIVQTGPIRKEILEETLQLTSNGSEK